MMIFLSFHETNKRSMNNNLVGGRVPLFLVLFLLQTRLTIKLFAKTVKLRSKTLGFNEIEDGIQNARWDYAKRKYQRTELNFPP